MVTSAPNRRPAGTSAGGQFAPGYHPESSLSLDVPDEAAAPPLTSPEPVGFGHLDREARIEAMRAEIDRALDEMSDPEGWARFLDSQAKFHRYSFGNTMLIVSQRPDATQVAGFNDWKNKFGRTVKKGEKAIWVMAPITKKVTEVDPATGAEREAYRMVGAKAVAVFDASQTEGDPLPEPPNIPGSAELEGEAPPGMAEDLTRSIEASGFTLRYGDTGAAGGWTSFGSKEVVISESASPRAQARTLAHEMAHIALDHGDSAGAYHTGPGGKRPDMEVEAESVAYVVGRHYGLDDIGSSTFSYIDGWARGDKDRVKKTANNVATVSKKILDALGK